MQITLEDIAYRFLPRVRSGRALAPRERLTLVRVAEVLMDGAPHGISADEIAENVEQFLIAGRSRRAWRVRLLLQCIELLPLATHGRAFSALSRERRRAVVEEHWIAGKPFGRICAKVKNLVIVGAYGDPRAAAKTGYVPVLSRRRFQEYALRAQEARVVA